MFSIMGKNYFIDRRHYLEVEGKTNEEPGARPSLGLYSDTVKRYRYFIEFSEEIFCIILYKNGKFKVFMTFSNYLLLR